MSDPPFAERQTPAPGEIFLDHVGWYVPDMDAAGAAFERLGFILTPFTPHSHEGPDGERSYSGTANRCAMVGLGYLEILCALPELDTPLARQLRAGLESHTGLHLIAFTCADAAAEHARIAAAGLDPQQIVNLRRPIAADDGSDAMTAFSVVRLPPDAMPEGRVQMLTQETPETVWQPSMIARDNGIDALTGVVVCARDAGASAARFARLLGRAPRPGAHGPEIALDRGRVHFVAPEDLGALVPGAAVPSDPFIAAVVMRSRDMAATRDFLAGRGVGVQDVAGAIAVDPADAMGASMVIHGDDAVWPA